MNEKFIILMEKYLENEISIEETLEFENLLKKNNDLKIEFEEQKKIKEVLRKMNLKNPSEDLWDGYWDNTYNKLERSLGWLAFFIGALILIAFASIEFVNQLYNDNSSPLIVKIGVVSLVFGLLVLLFSVIREKYFTNKNDKYKEIQR